MYGFMLDQSYINLFILVIIVSIVMFLWRKLIILEGNFFVLEKRVNLIKKDAREDSIAKNIDKADIIMNEIFKDFSPLTPSNACKQSVCGSGSGVGVGGTDDDDVCYPQTGGACDISIDENMVQFISKKSARPLESVCGEDDDCDSEAIITFANGGNIDVSVSGDGDASDDTIDIDKMIGSSEEYENKACIELIDAADAADAADDTMSLCSEITFTTTDDKALKKKYVKMSLDKLKDVCGTLNINGEGTRNELINRIITVKK
jgi:hypothetical protein